MIEFELAVVIGVVVVVYVYSLFNALVKKLRALSLSSIQLVMSYNNVVTSLHIAGKALEISLENDNPEKLRDTVAKAANTLQSIQSVQIDENKIDRSTIPPPPAT